MNDELGRGDGKRVRTCGTWEAHLRYLKEDRGYRARYLQSQRLIGAYLSATTRTRACATASRRSRSSSTSSTTPRRRTSPTPRSQSQIDVLNRTSGG